MSSAYLPISERWHHYVRQSDDLAQELEEETARALGNQGSGNSTTVPKPRKILRNPSKDLFNHSNILFSYVSKISIQRLKRFLETLSE